MTAQQLRTARQALGLSQRELAEALGVDTRTVRRWEHGDQAIPGWIDARAAVTVQRLHLALQG